MLLTSPGEYVRDLKKKNIGLAAWYREKETVADFFVENRDYRRDLEDARWLELGCGSYLRDNRHPDENHFKPLDVEARVKEQWEVVGVDIVSLGKEVNGWCFIQGDVLVENTWDKIGRGYHVVNAEMLFSLCNARHISPGFKPGGRSLYQSRVIQKEMDLLQDSDYFSGLDFILTRVHRALIEGGIFIIDHEYILIKSSQTYVAEVGFEQQFQKEFVRKNWTVHWCFPSNCK